MPDNDFEKLEQALVRAGQAFTFPATPALAARVRAQLDQAPAPRSNVIRRRAVLALAALAIAFGLLLAFPETRDALAQFLGLRTIRIIPATPTPTSAPGAQVIPLPSSTLLSIPSPTPVGGRFQCCATTLADAQARARFKVLLPPSESPSQVNFQDVPVFGGSQQLILVFGDPSAPRVTLFEATGFLYGKIVNEGTVIEETRVHQERALWLAGAPHVLIFLDPQGQPQYGVERSVDVNTLAWEMNSVTYRLETPLSKEQAIAFAESLR